MEKFIEGAIGGFIIGLGIMFAWTVNTFGEVLGVNLQLVSYVGYGFIMFGVAELIYSFYKIHEIIERVEVGIISVK
jgi:uncharacterized membrane protein YedE/YeeE